MSVPNSLAHDPLCPFELYGADTGLPAEGCQCALIAHVRADEREAAASRVSALPPCEPCALAWHVHSEAAANAARGAVQA